MAKKGAVQLQVEVGTDDEWDKLLDRKGLIIVDVYSDWCGNCQSMAAGLRKIKLEVGGDMLHLAVAKNDTIAALERFRGKSEPIWMFIAERKVTNLLFGADAPKLTRVVLAELKKEQDAQAGLITREGREVTEMFEEEKERFRELEEKKLARLRIIEEKKAKELFERRTAEANAILEALANFGVMIVLPAGREKYADVVHDVLHDVGLMATVTEKVVFTEELLAELFYFPKEIEFDDATLETVLGNEGLVLLLKPSRGSTVEEVHPAVLEMVYGPSMKPPGSPDSLYHKLFTPETDVTGIWAPHTDLLLATTLRMFFPRYSKEYTIPEPEPTPPYIAIAFDQKKMHDVIQIISQYPNEIMHYGFFTSDVPEDAKLVAKSVRKLEKALDKRTFQEKMVLQVSKKKSECIFAFAQLSPTYMSPNPEEGERECGMFFPESYAEDLTEEDLAYEDLAGMVSRPVEEEVLEEGELMNVEGEGGEEEELEEEEEEEVEEEVFVDLFGDDF